MQKLYALTLAAATVFSASAGVHELKQNPHRTVAHTVASRTLTAPVKSVSKQASKATYTNAANAAVQSRVGLMKADGKANEIAGEYIFTIDDVYFDGGAGTISTTATIVDNGDATVTFSSEWIISPITAAYDKATQTITFAPEELGQMTFTQVGTFYVKFEPGVWSSTTGAIDGSGYSVTFDANKGSITFPADHNFGWKAYTNATYNDNDKDVFKGYLDLYDVLSLKADSGEVPGDFLQIAGDYTATGADYYWQDSTGQEMSADAEIVDNENGTIMIDCELFPLPILAAYNSDTNVVTFTEFEYGPIEMMSGATYYGKFVPGYWDSTIGDIVEATYTVKYDTKTGTMTFPADHNFGWPVYEDENYTTLAGYMDLFDMVSLVKKGSGSTVLDEEQIGMWKDCGKANFVDAWATASLLIEGVGVNPADYAFEVPLQQSVSNPNVYRLWAPYHQAGFIQADANMSEYQGQIVFDVTDPEHVVFQCGLPAGYLTGNGELYAFDILGWQIWGFGDEWDASYLPMVIEYMQANDQTFATFADGVVTVNTSVFDFEAACTHAYSWNNPVTTVSTITFPDMDGVEMIEENNAPVEYFNMQGIRVENPAAGMILIKRQGKETSKVVVR